MNVVTLTLPIPMVIIKGLAHTMAFIKKVIPLEFRLTPDKIHELTPKYWLVNSERSVKELGMEYKWSLDQTIEVTYQDYRERGWI